MVDSNANGIDESAIEKLTELGFNKDQALDALLKHNNIVDRAADYLYSNTDSDIPNLTSLTSSDPNKQNTWGDSATPRNNDEWDTDVKTAIAASMADQDEQYRRAMHASLTNSTSPNPMETSYSNSRYQSSSDNFDSKNSAVNGDGSQSNSSNQNYINGWGDFIDPEQPMKRQKLDTTPLGLRPTFDSYYVTSIIQALFHIPIVRLSILKFTPTRESWGEVEGYWKGKAQNLSITDNDYYGDPEFNNDRKYTLICIQRTFGDVTPVMSAIGMEDIICGWDQATKISYRANTVYLAIDAFLSKTDETFYQKDFFGSLSKILIMTVNNKPEYNDTNSSNYNNQWFQIDKEIYMDRYLISNASEVEDCLMKSGDIKRELEQLNKKINNITNFQERYNGQDLLKSSIKLYHKAKENGVFDEKAQKTCAFLEKALEQTEKKIASLLERKDKLELKLKQIYETPNMKNHLYNLRSVLINDNMGTNSDHFWAYIWVSNSNKPIGKFSTSNGGWWKFRDMKVEEVTEETVLNDFTGLYTSRGIYTLIYVAADVDYNFSNISDAIPYSLKEFIEKDNELLSQETQNNFRDRETSQEQYNQYSQSEFSSGTGEAWRNNGALKNDPMMCGDGDLNDINNGIEFTKN
ncbi:7637_t:CDS:10 [Entrophospora sp. SA101]|nr:7637_t:CDS:10 [Entrophospora sp. SA101]